MSRPDRETGRTCLGCRARRPRAELIRIVRGPDGRACFDLEGRLPGRGAWFCPSPACLEALAPGALGHVLRAPVQLPPASARRQDLAAALGRRVANLLTMARRMRGVTFGQTGVRALLDQGRCRLLLLAGDLPTDTAASWARRAGSVAVRTVPDAHSLGALCGRGPVDVAAVTVEGLAASLLQATDRWRAFSVVSCDNVRLDTMRTSRVARGNAAAGGG